VVQLILKNLLIGILVRKKIKIDIPSLQIQKEPFTEGLMTGKIEEDTFFKEEK
jgi:hypothetical protein